MQFGFSTLGCPAWSLERVAEAAGKFGYAGVELRLIDGEVITPPLVRGNLRRIESLFGTSGPKIIGLGSSARFAMADSNERAKNEQEVVELLDLARDLGVPMVRVFGGRIPAGEKLDAGVSRLAESLNRLAPNAERAGVRIGLETHDDFSRSAAVADVLNLVPSAAVGALWDTHHPFEMGEPTAVVWTNLANRLLHVHLKDAKRRADSGWDLVLLGDGEVPCREILRALALRGYPGWVVAEWEKKWHPELAEPDVAMPQHLAKMREWIADLACRA
jgi:sugar phosphate isomerase/epimerase